MSRFALFLATWLAIPTASLFADTDNQPRSYHFVLGTGVGVVSSSNAGRSTTFEFYEYTPSHKVQTHDICGDFMGAEWQFSPQWNIQFGMNFKRSSPFKVKGTLSQTEGSFAYKYKIQLRQLLLEGKLFFFNYTRFCPFVQLGVGRSFNKSYSFSTTVPPSTLTRKYKDNITTGVTYTVGGGLDIEMKRRVRFGISSLFTNFGKASLGPALIGTTPVSGTLSQRSFYAFEAFSQLSFVF